MRFKSFEFTVQKENDNSTLKTFLRQTCGITARSMTILKYGEGGIFREGEELKACDLVRTGDAITLKLPVEPNEIEPVKGDLDFLFEDDYLLIVSKPAHMPVHPTKRHQHDTLANIVSYYQREKGESYVFRALNRLDMDTSGCVMIAKDRLTYALVKDSIRKIYVAVCEGVIDSAGTIDLPIGLAEGSKIRRAATDNGAAAVTHYKPIESGYHHTLLELRLETGRTHQIRCHMSAIGHPLAGDDLYGGSLALIDRQALHCRTVSFIHPYTNEEHIIDTPVPREFLRIIKREG